MLPIRSRVPHDSILNMQLRLHGEPLDKLVSESRRYESAYLAWETVRLVRNPFFRVGTGFEGYFVGIVESSDEMLAALLIIGSDMLKSIYRLYRHQYIFRTRMIETLQGERHDLHAIEVWASLFGATLGRLRCNIFKRFPTYRFQNETYWAVNRLPPIQYAQYDHVVEQEYLLPIFQCRGNSKPELSLSALKPSQYEAGLVALYIGRYGHPLIREYLRTTENRTHCFED